MKEHVNFKKLSEEEKEYYTKRVVAVKLQQYIQMFIKMRKAGLTPLEVLDLRGLPLNKEQIKEALENQKILISILDKNNLEIIEPTNRNF